VGQQGLLEGEETGLRIILQASIDGLIETLMQLLAKFVERDWTLAGRVVSLTMCNYPLATQLLAKVSQMRPSKPR
jgi:hypothetical protein